MPERIQHESARRWWSAAWSAIMLVAVVWASAKAMVWLAGLAVDQWHEATASTAALAGTHAALAAASTAAGLVIGTFAAGILALGLSHVVVSWLDRPGRERASMFDGEGSDA